MSRPKKQLNKISPSPDKNTGVGNTAGINSTERRTWIPVVHRLNLIYWMCSIESKQIHIFTFLELKTGPVEFMENKKGFFLCTPLFCLFPHCFHGRLFMPLFHTLLLPVLPSPSFPLQSELRGTVFPGSSHGPARVTHLLSNSPPPSFHLLWSDYRRSNRKYLAWYTQPDKSPVSNLPHPLTHARPVGGRLISLLKWSLLAQSTLVAQQCFGKSARVHQMELPVNNSILATSCYR